METDELVFKQGTVRIGEKARRNVFVPDKYISFEVSARVVLGMGIVEIWARTFRNGTYGILGGRFVPDTSGIIRVSIGIAEDIQLETIEHVGLTERYAEVVATRLREIIDSPTTLASGILTIDCAYYHEIYSNSDVFRLLASIIGSILRNDGKLPSEADVDAWFHDVYIDSTTKP